MVNAVGPSLLEDVSASTYIEEMIEKVGGRPGELLLRADSVAVRGRRMFEKLIRDEQRQIVTESVVA